MSAGRIALAGGVAVGTVWLVRRMVDSGFRREAPQLSEAELEPWEREALQGGDVGPPEGHDPSGVDAIPVGRGVPEDYCITLGAGDGEDGDADPYCVLDPLSDPRFAPVDRGAPQPGEPSNSTWPVLTSHSGRLVVSYWTAGGVRGYSGRAFAAKRTDDDGSHRKHAGVDLFAKQSDVVVAPEDGRVLTILPFNAGTWAVYIRSMLDDRVVNLGEVEKFSWREFGMKPGQPVHVGQPLARIGMQTKGSTMLHFETYGVDGIDDETVIAGIRQGKLSWPADASAPSWLRDPTAYLLTAARRTYQRELLGLDSQDGH